MTTGINKNQTIGQIVATLANMDRTACQNCEDGYIFTGEGATDICPSGMIHVRMDEAVAFFPELQA